MERLRRARSEEVEAHKKYRAAEREVREAEEAYIASIAEAVRSLLNDLKWEFPKKRGKRQVSAYVHKDNPSCGLFRPLFEDDSARMYGIDIPVGGTRISVSDVTGYGYSHPASAYARIKMSPDSAKMLGIINPVQRKDWSKIKSRLEEAGLTDEDQILELLQKKRESAE